MMIPVILLGEARDRHLLDALRSLLGERCAWQTREGIFWKADAKVLLLELSASSWVDVGGGLVVLKENFLPKHLPEHLLHARCILPDRGAEELLQCGLPCIRCGDAGELRMSSTQERAVVCVQSPLARLDGSCIAQGEHSLELPLNLSVYEMLCCAAVLLLLGMEK